MKERFSLFNCKGKQNTRNVGLYCHKVDFESDTQIIVISPKAAVVLMRYFYCIYLRDI